MALDIVASQFLASFRSTRSIKCLDRPRLDSGPQASGHPALALEWLALEELPDSSRPESHREHGRKLEKEPVGGRDPNTVLAFARLADPLQVDRHYMEESRAQTAMDREPSGSTSLLDGRRAMSGSRPTARSSSPASIAQSCCISGVGGGLSCRTRCSPTAGWLTSRAPSMGGYKARSLSTAP